MKKMTVEDIAQHGPDGTTPLMELFANVSKKKDQSSKIESTIIHFHEKFVLNTVLESSIYFGNVDIFSKLFTLGISKEESKHFATLATLTEDINILEIIFARFPSLKEYCREIGRNCQTVPMREMLELSMEVNVNPQLVKMSAKFPKFNEGLEIAIKKISKDVKSINIKMDIEPLLKKQFCGLVACYGKHPKTMPISTWRRHLYKEKHKRLQKIFSNKFELLTNNISF